MKPGLTGGTSCWYALVVCASWLALAACVCINSDAQMEISGARVADYTWGEVFSGDRARQVAVARSEEKEVVLASARLSFEMPEDPAASMYLEYVDGHMEGVFIVFAYGKMDTIGEHLVSKYRGGLLCGGHGARRKVTTYVPGKAKRVLEEDHVKSRYCRGRIGGIPLFRPVRVILLEPMTERNVGQELPDSVDLLRRAGLLGEAKGLLALYR